MSTPPPGWFPDPSNGAQNRWWDGARWTESVTPPVAVTTLPPPAGFPSTARKAKRRLPVWAWIVIGVAAVLVGILIAPVIALISLVVVITGIVALARNTPTWLRFRSRKAAVWITVAAAALFFATGTITSAFQATEPKSNATNPSITSTPTPSPTSAPNPDEVADPVPFAGEASTASDTSATAGTALAVLATLEVKGRAAATGYDRDQFGQRWLDIDRNGCDSRIIYSQ